MRCVCRLGVAAALVGLATLSSAAERKVEVTVDATKTGAPIAPGVYGQFIEHLGRCIYGGLWAEMLEDRKFFFPVTGEAPAWELHVPKKISWEGDGYPFEILVRSPWIILGEKAAVKMVTEGALAGEHSPEVELPGDGKAGGIQQERLGLLAGKEYVGRIVLAGDATAAPLEVSLVYGTGATDRHTIHVTRLSATWATVPLRFRAGLATDNGRLEILSRGKGRYRIGAVSLMPSDNVRGWRRDTLARLRELDSPVYRWPGGNFVSGYDWQDGIGDPDKRPPRKNPAWKGIEHNDVGIHEFLELCREIGTEPYVAVNTGLGGIEGARAEVEYLNGARSTPMGELRSANGQPKPFGVKLFAVGNEMYGDWQLGHMSLDAYVKKHNATVEAMRGVDRSIELVAVGAVGDWSRRMLTDCASSMTMISEHVYWQSKENLLEHVGQTRDSIRKIAEAHRAYRREIPALKGKDIRVALDEWNYWYGPNEYGELGTRYFLDDGLGIAVGLHEMFRQSDIYAMANYAQTVNVIGAIKTTATEAEMETTGLVLALYRKHFGALPLGVGGEQGDLDVVASRTSDGRAITLAVVNPTEDAAAVSVGLTGAEPVGQARRWTLTGPSRRAHNAPGQPRQVTVAEETVGAFDGSVSVPPLSVVLYEVPVR